RAGKRTNGDRSLDRHGTFAFFRDWFADLDFHMRAGPQARGPILFVNFNSAVDHADRDIGLALFRALFALLMALFAAGNSFGAASAATLASGLLFVFFYRRGRPRLENAIHLRLGSRGLRLLHLHFRQLLVGL